MWIENKKCWMTVLNIFYLLQIKSGLSKSRIKLSTLFIVEISIYLNLKHCQIIYMNVLAQLGKWGIWGKQLWRKIWVTWSTLTLEPIELASPAEADNQHVVWYWSCLAWRLCSDITLGNYLTMGRQFSPVSLPTTYNSQIYNHWQLYAKLGINSFSPKRIARFW